MNGTSRRYAAQVFHRNSFLLRNANALGERVHNEVAATFRTIIGMIGLRADLTAIAATWAAMLRKLPGMLSDGIEDAVAEQTLHTLKDLAGELGQAFASTQEADRLPLGKAFRQQDVDKRLADLTAKKMTQAKTRQLVKQNAWRLRLAAQTKLASPDEIVQTIQDGLAKKKTIEQIANDLKPKVQGVASTANRIARHETMWAAHRANLESWESLGTLVVAYQVHSQRDSRVRPAHAKRDGFIYWKKPKGNQRPLSKMPHPPYEANGEIAFGCRCVTGEARITGDIRSICRSWYDGEAIELFTSGGARLTVTANHPMATPDGMIPANQIAYGDYLLTDAIDRREFPHNINNDEPSIKDIFEALSINGELVSRQRPDSLEFHGDGQFMQGNVDMVFPNRELVIDGYTKTIQCQNEFQFIGRTTASMSSNGLSGLLGVGHFRPLEQFSIPTTTNRDSGLFQHANKSERLPSAKMGSASRQTECIGQRFQRLASEVSLYKTVGKYLCLGKSSCFRFSSQRDPGLLQPSGNSVAFDTAFASQLCARYSRFISADKIVKVRRFHMRSYVYSVDSGLGYYMGSESIVNAVQGNCFVSPILNVKQSKIETEQKQWGPLDRDVMGGWFDAAPHDVKIAAVGANRYNTLRRILGRNPTWRDLTNNRGRLLDVPELRTRHAA